MGGLAAVFSGKMLLSALGLVERLGSKLFGEYFAKYPGASGGEILLGTLGPGGGLGSELFRQNFAKCPGANGEAWQRICRGKFR